MNPQVIALLKSTTFKGGQYALKQLIGFESEQVRLLNRLELKIDAALESCYQQGLIYLQDALDENDSSQRMDYLSKARVQFTQAVTNFERVDPVRSSWAAAYLTFIFNLSADSAAAQRWALRAYRAAVMGVQDECRRANSAIDGQVGKRLKLTGSAAVPVVGTALTALAWPAGVATFVGMKKYRNRQIQQARQRLAPLDEFADQLRIVAIALGERPIQGYTLTFDDDTKHFAYTRPLVIDPFKSIERSDS